ncbi:MAG: anti-sigma factor family protein [Phycisphaerae bacterium]
MSCIPDDLERLIVRQLDAELTEAEGLELNRRLIRNPEAQELMEQYRRAEELAVAALNRAIPPTKASAVKALPALPARRRLGYYRAWWVIPGAVAAAILALWIPGPSLIRTNTVPVMKNAPEPFPTGERAVATRASPREVMRNVGTGSSAQRIKRATGREVFGVVGDDGNVYWIQVDRIRTVRQPRASASGLPQHEAM